jgi:hypothetical protein
MAVVYRILRYTGEAPDLIRHLARRGVNGVDPPRWNPSVTITEEAITGLNELIELATAKSGDAAKGV